MDSETWHRTKEEYIAVKRVGRVGTNLARKLRGKMFDIRNEYLELRTQREKMYDWDDLASHVHQEFLRDNRPRLYRHIVIDEGQDFSPEMIRSLVSAIPADGSLTFFGDVAQQIYGQRMSWRSADLSIPKTWKFKENYRNTKQIARLGLAISEMSYFKGIADIVEPTVPRADGPLPTLVECDSWGEQVNVAVHLAENSGTTKTVAVLFKNRAVEEHIRARLPNSAIRLGRNMTSWSDESGIYYGTYHSAKGLEFDLVILPFLENDNLPDLEHISSHGKEDASIYYGNLIYVAVTRAKSELLLLYTGTVTPLLPTESWLYNRKGTP